MAGHTFVPSPRLIVLVDLAGFAKAFQALDDAAMAAFVQEYYAACAGAFEAAGGSVIKYMGDACLATFAPDAAERALTAVLALEAEVRALAKAHQVPIAGLGANLHIASVIDADFGAGEHRRRDILGRGVNQTFLLGGGAGVRLSEPVYRALPSGARSPWRKHKPPTVYHLERAGGGVLEGGGKSAGRNAARW